MNNQIVIAKLSILFAKKLQEELERFHEEKLQIGDIACIIANTMASFTSNIISGYDFTHHEKDFLISRISSIFSNQTYEGILREGFIKDLKIVKK